MTDIAQLGYSVDSSQLSKATVELDKNTAAAGRTQAATDKLAKDYDRMSKAAEAEARALGASAARRDRLSALLSTERGQRILEAEGMRRQADGLGKLGVGYGATALSAKQLVAAQRQLPMQFTDIFTTLQAGQSPMQVLLQQGGQLKDVFGGVGPALRASLGYLVGLINPVTVLAAGAGTLALAWKQNQDQLDDFNLSLARTNGFIGQTAEQLQDTARRIDRAGNASIGTAAEAVNRFVTGGRIVGEQLESVSRATAEWATISGDSIDDVAKRFESLAKDPVKALLRLNETEHFLTQTQLDRIQALVDEKREQDAVAEAVALYTDHLDDATRSARENLGEMAKLWGAVKNEVAGAWAEVQTYMGLLDKAAKATVGADLSTSVGAFLYNNPARVALRRINQAGQDRFGGGADFSNVRGSPTVDSAAAERAIEERKKAEQEWARLSLSNLSKAEKLEEEIKNIRAAGLATKKTEAEIEKAIANARARYAESTAKAAKAKGTDPTEALIRRLREQIALNEEQAKSEDRLTTTEKMLVDVRTELERIGGKGSATNRKLIEDLIEQAKATDAVVQATQRQREAAEALARQQAIFDQQGLNRARANEIDLLSMGRGAEAIEQLRRQLDIQREYQDELKRLGDRGVAKDKETWDRLAENARQFRDQQLEEERRFQEQRQQLQGDWSMGANRAFEDYLERARDVAGQTYEIFSNAFYGLENVIVDTLSKGSADWKGFLDDINRQILQFIVRQQLSKWMETLMGGAGGTGGGWQQAAGTFFGALFGGGRAYGGDVRDDRIYRVGEGNQPELLNLGRGRQFLLPGDSGRVEPMRGGGRERPSMTVAPTVIVQGRVDNRTAARIAQETVVKGRTALVRNGGGE